MTQINHYNFFFSSNFHKKCLPFHFFLQIFTKKVFNFILLLLFSFTKNYALNWLWVIEWLWVIVAHIFLPKKFMIVAHFFWEVIVSDLAHEKSELAQLWWWCGCRFVFSQQILHILLPHSEPRYNHKHLALSARE